MLMQVIPDYSFHSPHNPSYNQPFHSELPLISSGNGSFSLFHPTFFSTFFLDPVDASNCMLDTDGDGLEDYKENDPTTYFSDYIADMTENETNAQFNAFVREIIPPRIYNIDINEAIETGIIYKTVDGGPLGSYEVPSGYFIKHVWLSVEGDVFDISGVDSVTVVIDDDESEVLTDKLEKIDDYTYHFNTTGESLDVLKAVSLETYLLGSYDINIIAMDGSGNIADLELEQKSIVASITDAFLNLMGEIWDFAVDTALALGEMMYDWIMQIVEETWVRVLNPLIKAAKLYVNEILTSLDSLITEIMDWYWDGSTLMPDNYDETKESNDIMYAIMTFLLSVLGLKKYAEQIKCCIQSLQKKLEPYQHIISPITLIYPFIESLPNVDNLLTFANDFISNSIETIVSTILGTTMSSLSSILPTNIDAMQLFGSSYSIEEFLISLGNLLFYLFTLSPFGIGYFIYHYVLPTFEEYYFEAACISLGTTILLLCVLAYEGGDLYNQHNKETKLITKLKDKDIEVSGEEMRLSKQKKKGYEALVSSMVICLAFTILEVLGILANIPELAFIGVIFSTVFFIKYLIDGVHSAVGKSAYEIHAITIIDFIMDLGSYYGYVRNN